MTMKMRVKMDDFDNEDCALKQTWESLSPPISEEEIIGKWYGV